MEKELRECLEKLVNHYIANRGTDSEFIKCITPNNLRMSFSERMANPTWKLFDEARLLLGEKF